MFPALIETGFSVTHRLLLVSALQLVVGVWQHTAVSRLRVGWPRFAVSAPVFVVLLAIPALFSWHEHEVLVRISLIFTCAWLATFKVLGSCVNRGPLVAQPWSLTQFMILLYLPIYPLVDQGLSSSSATPGRAGRLQDASHGPARLLLHAAIKVGMLGAVVYAIIALRLPRFVMHAVYSLGLVGFLGLLMDAPASAVTSLAGLRIIPTFDAPWLSTSLADFWGRRWNITTSTVLRTLVYDPIVEGALIRPSIGAVGGPQPDKSPQAHGSRSNGHADVSLSNGTSGRGEADGQHRSGPRVAAWRRSAGVVATFVTSGLAHEAIINSMVEPLPTQGSSGLLASRPWLGKWTVFFSLQAPLLLGEMSVKRWWRKAGLPPLNPWLGRALTLTLLLTIADPFFFTPVDDDCDLAQRVVRAVVNGFRAAEPLLSTVTYALGWRAAAPDEL